MQASTPAKRKPIVKAAAAKATPPPALMTLDQSREEQLKIFGEKIHAAMLRKQMNVSDLARAIWGTVTDYRGFVVAKNRDRAGFYVQGKSYPNEENLKKLAHALDLDVEELRVEKPAFIVHKKAENPNMKLTVMASEPNKALLEINLLLPTKGALEVLELVNRFIGRNLAAETVVGVTPPTIS